MFRSVVLAVVLAVPAVALPARAQTAADLPSTPSVPVSGAPVHSWPATGSLPGRSLQLEVTGENSHVSCRLREFTADHVYCVLPHNRTLSFDRSQVLDIKREPAGSAALHFATFGSFYGGLFFLALSSSCGFDGGPPCDKSGTAALSMLGSAAVLKIVEIHRRHAAALIYSAP